MTQCFYINAEQSNAGINLTYAFNGEIKYATVKDYNPTLYSRTASNHPPYRELVAGFGLEPTQFKSVKEANDVIRRAHKSNDVSIYGNRNFHYTFLHENFKDMENSYDPSLIRGYFLDIEAVADIGFPDAGKAEWPINALTIYDTFTEKYYVWGTNTFSINDACRKLLRHEGITMEDDVVYYQIYDEKEMLRHLLRFWRKNFPAYITGWNTKTFDMPYICHRLQRLGLDMNKLSPWKRVSIREGEYYGKPEFSVNISGIADLDYLQLYKKNRFITRESYKLDFIAYLELGRKKVDYSKVANDLRGLYKKDWDTFVTYNIIDVALIKALEDKLGFLGITFAVAYKAGINYGDVKSPVATWENLMYRELIGDGVVLPNKQDHDKASYEGGYVKPPQVGKHRWVCSFDLNSLYPHLIMQFNISPETITDTVVGGVNVDTMVERTPYEQLEADLAVCPSGNTFLKDKYGVAGQQMWKLYCERKEIKAEMLCHKQDVVDITGGHFDVDGMYAKYKMVRNPDAPNDHTLLLNAAKAQVSLKSGGEKVRKILLNSFYGALANVYCCFFDIRLAESITLSGQLAIRWVGRKTNEYLNRVMKTEDKDYVIYTDTDSIYVCLEEVARVLSCGKTKFDPDARDQTNIDLTVDALDEFCKTYMEPMIDSGYNDLAEYTNAYQQKMIMKREVISDNSVFLSKKRYAMSVWNSEGVAEDEADIKVMGMDMVKSSTPQVVRDAMKATVAIILNGTERELHAYVDKFYKTFQQESPENIAFPRGVNKLEETYCMPNGQLNPECTVPINSRAAITYNQCLDNYKLDYERIVNGDKIKYLHLQEPNKLQQNVIAFNGFLPQEFGLHHKVDYEMMYDKTYKKPMETMVEIIGWSMQPRVTLDMLFGAPMYTDEDIPKTDYKFIYDEEKDYNPDTFKIDYSEV